VARGPLKGVGCRQSGRRKIASINCVPVGKKGGGESYRKEITGFGGFNRRVEGKKKEQPGCELCRAKT